MGIGWRIALFCFCFSVKFYASFYYGDENTFKKFPGGYETELNLNSMSFKKTDSMLPV